MNYGAAYLEDPFIPVPWWVLEELLETIERQRKGAAMLATDWAKAEGRKPFDWGDTPERRAAVRASIARGMAGIKLNPSPYPFD
jgi:hypothetical protein